MPSCTRVPVAWRSPASLAPLLAARWGHEGLIWLDGDGTDLGRWATLAVDPLEQRCCRGLPGEAGASDPFAALADLGPGHWCGWLSYEAAAWVEPGNPWKPDTMASLWIARHDPVLRFDLVEQQLWLEGLDPERLQAMARWLEALPAAHLGNGGGASPTPQLPVESWQWHTTSAAFSRGVEHIRELIACGDLFQANLTACCSTTLPHTEPGIGLALFARLRERCPAPFAGLVVAAGAATGEAVISASPERFLQVSPDGGVETRPIKGTRPRHSDPQRDADQAAELVCSSKDRAENVMIVDLLRNDLGRACVPGSIHVPQLVGLESYAQVHHLTSVVCGQLQPGLSWVDLLRAGWPGGSISGAPKLRACQRLADLEPVARGPYCGSLIRQDFDGSFDSSILIRTLLLQGEQLRGHAGCGIVADSDPSAEASELGWKLNPLLEALA
ncbi:anthranilate synthase component I family protein [Vulcanococcus sp. Clear-D1]|jgi:para-aminobenzoate synthetase component 1|uniref:anthranilate synthase component I family protein n=1 Tax=Vulcanococcus sp. Clear-D1 TaxID=2766970 RepID=UPI0019C8EEF6|nr:anthranilate synthase component I family protein [Vulcanococcus sp. Clear-D1]MBD1194140.1 anthranilate synthase component I family protein [Vulcanococcus sp. Clear-D1]